jgi:RNA polymerase sigma factor (sigma-70 family)
MRQGDRDALAEFMSRHERLIRARYRRRLGQYMRRVFDSEDLFATVKRRLDRYVASGTLEAEHEQQLWALIGTIADRVVGAQIRRIRRSSDLEANARSTLARPTRPQHDRVERRELIRRIFGQLTGLDREIVFRTLRGQTQATIAAELGLSEPAVRQRWYRLRSELRLTLDDSR